MDDAMPRDRFAIEQDIQDARQRLTALCDRVRSGESAEQIGAAPTELADIAQVLGSLAAEWDSVWTNRQVRERMARADLQFGDLELMHEACGSAIEALQERHAQLSTFDDDAVQAWIDEVGIVFDGLSRPASWQGVSIRPVDAVRRRETASH